MIGEMLEQDKVIKFWNSSRSVIQKGLWRDNLNPEISSWDQVVAQAEIIEISEYVAERRDRKLRPSQPTGLSGGNLQSMGQLPGRSTRAITSNSRRRSHNRDKQRLQSVGHQNVRDGLHPHRSARDSLRQPQIPMSRDNNYSSPERDQYLRQPKSESYSSESYHISDFGRGSPLSEEKAELHTAGRCFNCQEEGHTGRNCPNNHTD